MDRTIEFESLTENRGRPRMKRYSPFDDVTSLRTKINKMKAHLARYGHDYLDTHGWIPGASVMNDERRNRLDRDVEDFINICNEKRDVLQSEMKSGTDSAQVIQHREAVIEIMTRTLNDFVSFYTQLRTTRMKRILEKQRYDRIESATGNISLVQEYESINSDTINLDDIISLAGEEKLNRTMSGTADLSKPMTIDDCQQHSLKAAEYHTSISPDEIQELAFENSQILEELSTLDDEVKLIGKKVVQISKLQELFTEKVLEQELDLNNLHESAIKSSENVREGNDLIRDAMMKNASTRVFILFYIITLGFTILFLDWYNP